MNWGAFALIPFGLVLVGIGGLHLARTDQVFDFYRRWNENRRLFQMFGGMSPRMTRIMGWGLIYLGALAIVGAFTTPR